MENISLRNVKLADMQQVIASTEESPYVGTSSLATCVGLLMYNPKTKKAIVAHLSTEWRRIMPVILNNLYQNNLLTKDNYRKTRLIFDLFLESIYKMYPPAEKELIEALINRLGITISNVNEDNQIEYLLISGFHPNNYNIEADITSFFESLGNVFVKYKGIVDEKSINRRESETFNEFAFDASTGTFVTEEVFGKEEKIIHKK